MRTRHSVSAVGHDYRIGVNTHLNVLIPPVEDQDLSLEEEEDEPLDWLISLLVEENAGNG